MTIPFHPYANVFPMMAPQEQMALAGDIRAHGLRNKIVMHEGMILDGRNRYEACKMAPVDPEFTDFDGPDALAFVISANLHRRHLDTSQRAMVAAALANLKRGDNQHTEISGTSQGGAATRLSVSDDSVGFARKVLDKTAPSKRIRTSGSAARSASTPFAVTRL